MASVPWPAVGRGIIGPKGKSPGQFCLDERPRLLDEPLFLGACRLSPRKYSLEGAPLGA